jgi:hypothetical protein
MADKLIEERIYQPSTEEISIWLETNFLLFGLSDPAKQEVVKIKYRSESYNIWIIELHDNLHKIGHASVIKQEMYLNKAPVLIGFMTNIYIYPEYRGRKMLVHLISAVEKTSQDLKLAAIIVIARRQVKDMYYKFGYKGFGIFPELVLQHSYNQNIELKKQLFEFNLMATRQAYLATYSSLDGTVVRNDKYWNGIKKAIELGIYNFLEIKENNSYIYRISKDGTVLEVAGDIELLPKLLEKTKERTFKIIHDHPFFDFLLTIGGIYSFRPEQKEGHLIKIFSNERVLSNYLNGLVLDDQFNHTNNITKKNALNIIELNEW